MRHDGRRPMPAALCGCRPTGKLAVCLDAPRGPKLQPKRGPRLQSCR
jgi:hypothetical protein